MMGEHQVSTEYLLNVIGLLVGSWSSLLTLVFWLIEAASVTKAMRRALDSFVAKLADLRQLRS